MLHAWLGAVGWNRSSRCTTALHRFFGPFLQGKPFFLVQPINQVLACLPIFTSKKDQVLRVAITYPALGNLANPVKRPRRRLQQMQTARRGAPIDIYSCAALPELFAIRSLE